MEEHIDLFKKILTKIDDKVDYCSIIGNTAYTIG